MKTIKACALCDNAIIKCKGSVENLSFPVFGSDTMEFLLSIWYSFDLVTSMKVNQKPTDFVRKDARRYTHRATC